MSTVIFPQYRSIQSFNRHYKIVSDRMFIEATLRNGAWEFQTVEAVQYPEILRIQDMLNCEFSFVESNKEDTGIFSTGTNSSI